jgi:hypothetical protein
LNPARPLERFLPEQTRSPIEENHGNRCIEEMSPARSQRGTKVDPARFPGRAAQDQSDNAVGKESRANADTIVVSDPDTCMVRASGAREEQEAPRSCPVVPSLNLSDIKEKQRAVQGRKKAGNESGVHSDSKIMNDASKRREADSSKVKVNDSREKEGKASKEWAYLTSSNLKECAKAYSDSTSRQHAMQRIKNWVQQSNPPYEANPSPGVPSLVTPSNTRKNSRSILTLWQSCCICPRIR